MSANTKIEWCDHSWSPWRGCTKVSPGCANCYAETFSKRNPAVLGQWGKGKPRVLSKSWDEPLRWNRVAELGECKCCGSRRDTSGTGNCKRCGDVRRIYTRPTVFPSLCDPFDDEVSDDFRKRFLSLVFQTPNLRWLLLTKRTDRVRPLLYRTMRRWSPALDFYDYADRIDAWISGERVPHNVWLGTSVEDQERTNRIAELMQIPAAGRFLSVEPLLGPVDFSRSHRPHSQDGRPLWPTSEPMLFGIDWVIIGGESGRGARPCNVEWIRSLVGQCKTASVPVFVKQLGARPVLTEYPNPPLGDGFKVSDPKGGDPAEWPEDLRVREFPKGLR